MAGGNKGNHYVPRIRVGLDDESKPSSGSKGGGSGGGGEDPCNITQVVNLNGPVPAVVSQLSVGSCLDVQLQMQNGQPVIVAIFRGQIAGSIGAMLLSRLTQCLQSGVTYKATVLDLSQPGFVKLKLERGSCP